MAHKKGMAAAFASGVVVAATTALALRRSRYLQAKARAAGKHVPYGPYEAVVKRPLDAAISMASLVMLLPMLAATAIAVRIKLGSPVLFTQQRPGLDGHVFRIYKFRTMTDNCDLETGELLSDEERLTSFGKWLRSTSIDELPELINIVKGDMALIGPRPLLLEYLPYYTERERSRHDVRPGLTGWAQVNGRNNASWSDRFEFDLDYINRISFKTDLQIICLTVVKLLSRADVVVAGANGISDLNEERRLQSE